MDEHEVARMWDANAEAWTQLARSGYDVYRDAVNAPAFMAMLPDVSGLSGLDIGCGEGHNTRLVAKRGSKMTGVDISANFIQHARQQEATLQMGIDYYVANATALPFKPTHFDFAISTMSFMDMPNHERALAEAYRVLKPGAFLQFSISHPCFATPRWKWVRDESGKRVALECGDYFRQLEGDVDEWIFTATPAELKESLPAFRVPRFTRTLSSWLNMLMDTGFVLERFEEPAADEEVLKRYPYLDDTRVIAFFLLVRCRKP